MVKRGFKLVRVQKGMTTIGRGSRKGKKVPRKAHTKEAPGEKLVKGSSAYRDPPGYAPVPPVPPHYRKRYAKSKKKDPETVKHAWAGYIDVAHDDMLTAKGHRIVTDKKGVKKKISYRLTHKRRAFNMYNMAKKAYYRGEISFKEIEKAGRSYHRLVRSYESVTGKKTNDKYRMATSAGKDIRSLPARKKKKQAEYAEFERAQKKRARKKKKKAPKKEKPMVMPEIKSRNPKIRLRVLRSTDTKAKNRGYEARSVFRQNLASRMKEEERKLAKKTKKKKK